MQNILNQFWTQLSKITGSNNVANILILAISLLVLMICIELITYQSAQQQQSEVVITSKKPVLDQLDRFESESKRSFLEVVERPVFYQSREYVALAGGSKPLGSFELSGVLMTLEKRFAILRDRKTGEEKKVEEGMEINRWTLEKVEKNGVTLRSGSRVEKVTLKTSESKGRGKNSAKNRSRSPRSRYRSTRNR